MPLVYSVTHSCAWQGLVERAEGQVSKLRERPASLGDLRVIGTQATSPRASPTTPTTPARGHDAGPLTPHEDLASPQIVSPSGAEQLTEAQQQHIRHIRSFHTAEAKAKAAEPRKSSMADRYLINKGLRGGQ